MALQRLWLQKPWKVWMSVLWMSRNTKIHVFMESSQTSPAFIPFWIPLQPPPGLVHCLVCQDQIVESFHHLWVQFFSCHSKPMCHVFSTPSEGAQGKLESRQLGRGGRVAVGRTLFIFQVLSLCSTSLWRKEEERNAFEMEFVLGGGGCSFWGFIHNPRCQE